MIVSNVAKWLVQLGAHGGEWSVESVRVQYDGEPLHYHRIIYLGPLCFSWECIE